ncbi:TIGR04283 family arsenosugar biosynthesis glycosyltransferase [Companilactobacillus mishanensis]|uniref:TIGR04283 family arsenosugar biosynthesis glycosyltransferase n=1 Tax=Companilactobacillus mishanensis TaxID=2486008 RepID=UPI0012950BD6|nr:TIGR04283 family arsenosugar biosynthesis glycosyltransferase [Companilactobacillus mishanensis]MQS88873.1 glycosyltransferase [Companilactobacillus mishanensis]
MWLSIIIPTFRDDEGLTKLLNHLESWDLTDTEVIIVDGESRNRPRFLPSFVKYLSSPEANRGVQLRYGADSSMGENLLFVHADSVFVSGSPLPTLKNTPAMIGFFTLKFDRNTSFYKIMEFGSNLRARVGKQIFGDQGLFINKKLYQFVGGYPAQPLMEDMELSMKLEKTGVPFTQFSDQIQTSGRKYRSEGKLTSFFKMQFFKMLYWSGTSPEKLSKAYYRKGK